MSAQEEMTATVATRSRGQPWTADEDAALRAAYGRRARWRSACGWGAASRASVSGPSPSG